MKRFIYLLLLYAPFFVQSEDHKFFDSEILTKMSLREKIAQLCFAAVILDEESDQKIVEHWLEKDSSYRLDHEYVEDLIKNSSIGGVVFYGRYAEPEIAYQTIQRFQSISRTPLMITIDAESGAAWRLTSKKAMMFPYNMTLGAIKDLNLIYKTGYEIALQLKSLGIHVNFSPVVDANTNPDNPIIGFRSFGSDVQKVSEDGIAMMKGLQDGGVIACAKHFPGHGDTDLDSHYFLPNISRSLNELKEQELYPFDKLIQAGVKSIMTAHLEIPALEKEPGLPSSLSKNVVTDLLQNEMGFKGLIFTDALCMKGVSEFLKPGELELRALLAGNDVLLCPQNIPLAIDYIVEAVQINMITEELITEKVKKVLLAKQWAFEQSNKKEINFQTDLFSEQAIELKKELFEKAMTLVKSEPNFPANLFNSKTVLISLYSELNDFQNSIKQTRNFAVIEQATFADYLHDQEDNSKFSIFKFFSRLWKSSENSIDEAKNIVFVVARKSFTNVEEKNKFLEEIKRLKQNNKSITLVAFCNPYAIPFYDYADQVLFAYEVEPEAQIAAAKVLNGMLTPEGALPVSTNQ